MKSLKQLTLSSNSMGEGDKRSMWIYLKNRFRPASALLPENVNIKDFQESDDNGANAQGQHNSAPISMDSLPNTPAASTDAPEYFNDAIDLSGNGFKIPEYEMEGFCLSSVLTQLVISPQYRNIITHEASDLLIAAIARNLFTNIEANLITSNTEGTSYYDIECINNAVCGRLYMAVSRVLKNKVTLMRDSKSAVGKVLTCSQTGNRESNEDRHSSYPYLNELLGERSEAPLSFFGVFDGHGGVECANYVATHLHVNIARHPEIITNTRQAITDSFLKTNERWYETVNRFNLSTQCGATAVTAIIQDKNIYAAWAGDSSAVLFLKNGAFLDFVFPHKPSFENERQRIEHMGGYVQNDRVNGILAVSRSFGDFKYGCVTPEPDIMEYTLTGNELFLLLACDGLTDVLDPKEIANIVDRCKKNNVTDISAHLVQEALSRGSSDNVTVVYIPLDQPQVFSAKAITEPLNIQMPSSSDALRNSHVSLISRNSADNPKVESAKTSLSDLLQRPTSKAVSNHSNFMSKASPEPLELSPPPYDGDSSPITEEPSPTSNHSIISPQAETDSNKVISRTSSSATGNETRRLSTRPFSFVGDNKSLYRKSKPKWDFDDHIGVSELQALTELTKQMWGEGGKYNDEYPRHTISTTTTTTSLSDKLVEANQQAVRRNDSDNLQRILSDEDLITAYYAQNQ